MKPSYDVINNLAYKKTLEKRFRNKVNNKNPNSCHEWLGVKNRNGYGIINICNEGITNSLLVHRLSYVLEYGLNPFFNELNVCHTCDNPSCVNPNHLYLGTQKDNIRDCKNKGRRNQAIGKQLPQTKLTKNQVIKIFHDNRLQKDIAIDYHITRENVSAIKTRKSWKHLNIKVKE